MTTKRLRTISIIMDRFDEPFFQSVFRHPDDAYVVVRADVLRSWLGVNQGSRPEHPTDFTVETFATIFRRTPGTVRNWCLQGIVPGAYKFRGREWRIPHAAVEQMQRGSTEVNRKERRDKPVDLGSWRDYVDKPGTSL